VHLSATFYSSGQTMDEQKYSLKNLPGLSYRAKFVFFTEIYGIFKNGPHGLMEGTPRLPPLFAFDQGSRESSIDKDGGRDMLKASEEER